MQTARPLGSIDDMTAKEFLRQYEYAVHRIKRLEEEYKTEQLLIDAVRSLSDNDGMPHGNGISKPTEEKAIRLASKAQRLEKARLDAIEIRQGVFDVIDQLEGLEADVLTERYIKLKTWEEVCDSVSYTWHPVRLAWHRGLDQVQRIIGTR